MLLQENEFVREAKIDQKGDIWCKDGKMKKEEVQEGLICVSNGFEGYCDENKWQEG
jgi:hypothetical protein